MGTQCKTDSAQPVDQLGWNQLSCRLCLCPCRLTVVCLAVQDPPSPTRGVRLLPPAMQEGSTVADCCRSCGVCQPQLLLLLLLWCESTRAAAFLRIAVALLVQLLTSHHCNSLTIASCTNLAFNGHNAAPAAEPAAACPVLHCVDKELLPHFNQNTTPKPRGHWPATVPHTSSHCNPARHTLGITVALQPATIAGTQQQHCNPGTRMPGLTVNCAATNLAHTQQHPLSSCPADRHCAAHNAQPAQQIATHVTDCSWSCTTRSVPDLLLVLKRVATPLRV
jgi:hypothetical protein